MADNNYRIIGRQGQSTYLIEKRPKEKPRVVEVVDLDRETRFGPMLLDVVVGRGYWRDESDNQEIVELALSFPLIATPTIDQRRRA